MRFNESNDGQFRTSVKIEFRVGLDELVSGALYVSQVEGEELRAPSSKKEALAMARRALKAEGLDAWPDQDFGLAEIKAMRARILGLFPELAKVPRGGTDR